MVNPEEIAIATIKDLKGVFFYYVGDSNDKRISGLSIVYGDNKKLDYNYTYKYYKDYVIQVLKVYQKEKKNNKIILYNELTKGILNNYNISEIDTNNDTEEYSSNRINLSSIINYNIKDIEEYLRKIILSIMELETGNKDTIIKSFIGIKNKYLISCITSDNEEVTMSLECIKDLDNSYDIKMYFSNINLLKSISGSIIINDEAISIKWNNYDKTLFGEYYYSQVNDICNEYIVNDYDKVLYFGDDREIISDTKKELLLNYAKMLNIDCTSIMPTIKDNYILFTEDKNQIQDNVYYKRKNAYITFKKDYISIIYFYSEGINKFDETFNIPFLIEEKEVRFIKVDIDDSHYILKEIINIPTGKMSGEYQHKINKYCYYLYKVTSNEDLRVLIENFLNGGQTTRFGAVMPG